METLLRLQEQTSAYLPITSEMPSYDITTSCGWANSADPSQNQCVVVFTNVVNAYFSKSTPVLQRSLIKEFSVTGYPKTIEKSLHIVSDATANTIVEYSTDRLFTYDLSAMEEAMKSPMVELPSTVETFEDFEAWLERF